MLRKSVFAIFALACFGTVGTAGAAPIDLPYNTPLVLDFENIEQLNVAGQPGDDASCIDVPGLNNDWGCSDNWGFLRFSTIRTSKVLDPNADLSDAGLTTLYDTGTNGATEIFGMFYGLNVEDCSGGGAVACTASGGFLDLYWHETGIAGIDVVADLDPTNAHVDAVTGGILLARLVFDNGIIDGDPDTTVTSNVDLTTTFGQGTGNGFLSVDTSVVAPWTNVLNGNWFHIDGEDADSIRGNGADELRDVKFRNVFTAGQGEALDWNAPGVVGLTSSDPAEVMSAVPEPASLTLFGVGLGLAAVAARRRKKSA